MTKITIVLSNGRDICSEEIRGELNDTEVRKEGTRLTEFFKKEEMSQTIK